jgi:toxin YoeB
MITAWTEAAWEEYLHWQQEDEKILSSINDLIKDIKRDPFKGLGKPEPLQHALQGWWSRRITGEHRLV